MSLPTEWDAETDLLVIGFGFGGAATALAAAEAGLQPLIIEKMDNPGGLSITSGGGVAIATDAEGAFQCLKAACAGRTPDDVLRAFARELCELKEWLLALARSSSHPLEIEAVSGDVGYDLPGRDCLGWIEIKPIEGFTAFPWARGLRGGARLFKMLWDNIERRGIPVRCRTAAQELLVNASREVVGARADCGGKAFHIKARRAVVLACGGFEWNEEMKRQYFQAMPVYGVTARGNTGDGIRMAQAVGADLWHMWHFHGSYGFKPPGFANAIRHRYAGQRKPTSVMPWIAVDKDGRRFMNEIHPSPNDTNARPLDFFDPDRLEFPRIPAYLIFDDAGRARGPIGFPIRTAELDGQYEWSADNLKEVERGWILRAHSIAELAERINAEGWAHMDPAVLAETVASWNRCVEAGSDPQFLRPPGTMLPISSPPYYAIAAWPIVSNTQGGPVHNSHRQVLDPFGRPIPRLYTAGELGSIFGHLYLLGGNIAECFVSGRLAARHAATLPPWDGAARIPSARRQDHQGGIRLS